MHCAESIQDRLESHLTSFFGLAVAKVGQRMALQSKVLLLTQHLWCFASWMLDVGLCFEDCLRKDAGATLQQVVLDVLL